MYEKLKVAYDESNKILENIIFPHDEMINTSIVLEYIKKNYCPEINVFARPFSKFNISEPYGAMMLTEFHNDHSVAENTASKPSKATIILNSDTDAVFQRFSLLHELGHLVTFEEQDANNCENYIVSTHINYKITSISKDQYMNNEYLLKEQIANIFALRVLMPSVQFYQKMEDLNDIDEVAEFFGLTKDAVISRMMIGA